MKNKKKNLNQIETDIESRIKNQIRFEPVLNFSQAQ